MKFKHISSISMIFIIVMVVAVHVTCMALINRSPLQVMAASLKREKKYAITQDCGSGQNIENLESSPDPQLSKISQYQDVCGTMPASKVMFFTDMPNSDESALSKAKQTATTLKRFNEAKINPLVVIEPVTSWGSIDFSEFRSGFYDSWLDLYFKTLKSEGISDQQMGMWVPFPEANLPYWNHANSKPDDFAANATKIIKLQKKYFPKSHASIMLNSATYENDDFDWSRGEYSSLLPYLKDIPKGLIDSFGYQGLPWLPAATQSGSGVVDAAEYLNSKLAKEAADQLGVKSIWFNTGAFGRKYTLDPAKTITVSPEQRKDLLLGALTQAQKLRDQGFTVAINLFAEDKSANPEATDWSFWGNDPKTSPNTSVFSEFVRELKANNIELWLFDKKK